jgi:hypothetical protein
VCDQAAGLGFMTYWQGHGLQIDTDPGTFSEAESLALFGLPLTDAHQEFIQGSPYLVQWFERARFEWHPELTDQYKVSLGLLGYENRVIMPPAPPAAQAEAPVWKTAYDLDLNYDGKRDAQVQYLESSPGLVDGLAQAKEIQIVTLVNHQTLVEINNVHAFTPSGRLLHAFPQGTTGLLFGQPNVLGITVIPVNTSGASTEAAGVLAWVKPDEFFYQLFK